MGLPFLVHKCVECINNREKKTCTDLKPAQLGGQNPTGKLKLGE